MPPLEISTPPPLPATLSSRLRSTIDPATGGCKHHPAVQLCELVQGGSRWVVRRKICYKCGARPKGVPGGAGGNGGGRHRPGVSVAHPARGAKSGEGGKEHKGRRSRSVSVDRLGRSGRGGEGETRERHRSASHDRHRHRSHSARRSSGANVVSGGPLDLRTNPLAASSNRLEAAGRGRRSSRESDKDNDGGGRKGGRSRSRSNDALETALKRKDSGGKGRSRSRSNDALEQAREGRRKSEHKGDHKSGEHGGEHKEHGGEHRSGERKGKDRRESNKAKGGSGSSLHSRALEYTTKALEETSAYQDHPHLHPEPPQAIAHQPHGEPHAQGPGENTQAIVQAHPRDVAPARPHDLLQAEEEEEEFDESDPVIVIPTLTVTADGLPALPPPPPRTSEEMERHRERLEMRRAHIRREREERRRQRGREGVGKRTNRGEEEAGEGVEAGGIKKSASEEAREIREAKERRERQRHFSAPEAGAFDPPPDSRVAALGGPPESPKHGKPIKRHSEPVSHLLPSAAALAALGADPLPAKKDAKRERMGKRHSEMPSAAALALLEGRFPSLRLGTNDRAKSDSVRHDPSRAIDEEEAPPSAAAMALLDATLARKSERKLASERRKSHAYRHHQQHRRARSHDRDDFTETSELSFGTAKMYAPKVSGRGSMGGMGMGGEHMRMHPELEGVALPVPAATDDPDAPMVPPMDITVDRSRSLSVSRKSRTSEDPPSEERKERRGKDPEQSERRASRRVSASKPTTPRESTPREPKEGGRLARQESDDVSHSRALVKKAMDAADRVNEKMEKRASLAKDARPSRRSSSRPQRGHGDRPRDLHTSAPTLAASSARSARRTSSKGRVWDMSGNEVESKRAGMASRSVDHRSRTSRAARSEGSPPGGHNRRSKSASKAEPEEERRWNKKFHASAHSKDGRSRITSSTHPESNSSDEWNQSSPHTRCEEATPEQPVVLYKKRASKKPLEEHFDDNGTYHEKPFPNISFHSNDDRSRTSSISSSSTVDDGTTVDDPDEEGARGRSKSRAMDALKVATGGAKRLGTRSRSALGGLKDTRRKWQSALFM